jgi:uncharacterized protein with GYD domain
MATYISLVSYSQKGIEGVKESPSRLDAAKELFRALGGELKEFYLVMGQYDMIVISEAPDDESATRAALTLGSAGSVRTQTFRAFTEDEYRKIIETLP